MASSCARPVQRVGGSLRFSDVITRGALADQDGTGASGEIYTFLEFGGKSSSSWRNFRGKSCSEYVKPAYLLIWEHSLPSCERLVSRHRATETVGVCHNIITTIITTIIIIIIPTMIGDREAVPVKA